MGSTDLNKTSISKSASGTASRVYIDGPAGTFGDIQTVVIQPQGQGDFVYGISDTTFLTSSFNGGSTSVTDGVASISTGTNANGSASIKLKRGIKYRPGQGALGRFTALFDTAVANNFQLAGIGNDECGYYVGYNGTSFGVLHNTTAQVEIRTLTITVGAGTGTVTVTLDGTAVDVDVVGGADTTQTAYQLATLGDYSQAGDAGFTADAIGSTVVFTAKRPNTTSTGTYSVSGASIVGTFAQTKAGTDPTQTFIPQSSFNVDRLDGTGASGLILDPTKGNVFQIDYQYLGFGNATYSVEDPNSGRFIVFHIIKNTNNRITPVLKNPNTSVLLTSFNVGNTSNVDIKTASMSAFIEGDVIKLDPKFAKSFGISNLNTSGVYKPLALLKANSLFNGETCYGEFDILRLAGSNQANNQTLTIGFFTNAIISGDVNYEYIDNQRSLVSFATLAPASNAISNLASLVPFHEIVVGGDQSEAQDLDLLEFIFGQGDPLLIAVKTSGLLSGQVSINWFEQQ
jgi:hypothetical protein